MADNAAILTAFREELIAAGLVRRPSEAGAGYPCHIEPRDGAPAPGEREGVEDDAALVLSLFAGGELSEAGYDVAHRRRLVVDIRFRSATNAALRAAMALDAAIRERLIQPATHYGYGFPMGTDAPVYVHAAALWAGFGPISRGRDAAFDHVAKWALEVAP